MSDNNHKNNEDYDKEFRFQRRNGTVITDKLLQWRQQRESHRHITVVRRSVHHSQKRSQL
jgi:hypothetical protein